MADGSTFLCRKHESCTKYILKRIKKKKKKTGNLIGTNFEITLEKIKKSQDEIKNLGKEICDLKSSFTENMLKENVKKLEE